MHSVDRIHRLVCSLLSAPHSLSTFNQTRTLRGRPPSNRPQPQPTHFSGRGPRHPSGAVGGSQEISRRLHVSQYEKSQTGPLK